MWEDYTSPLTLFKLELCYVLPPPPVFFNRVKSAAYVWVWVCKVALFLQFEQSRFSDGPS